MKSVIVLIGAGSIGQAIVRRTGAGEHVVVADLRQDNADAAAKTPNDAGFDVTTATVDASSRASVHALAEAATALGEVSGVVHAAGVSPSQAPPEVILKVDLYGTALVLEAFGNVIARGGVAVVIASQSGHRLPTRSAGSPGSRRRSSSSCTATTTRTSRRRWGTRSRRAGRGGRNRDVSPERGCPCTEMRRNSASPSGILKSQGHS